ncbi:Hypothetical predicted protein [Podarcis lilfordi]|uniref:Uncharacterized protein n=1 Tax=Podarcis lilfordi TaxID=74358 RepID=A0AA35L7V6_9SAUR|nr:Hypothetical predicted protein [Podarcis lilfordi]
MNVVRHVLIPLPLPRDTCVRACVKEARGCGERSSIFRGLHCEKSAVSKAAVPERRRRGAGRGRKAFLPASGRGGSLADATWPRLQGSELPRLFSRCHDGTDASGSYPEVLVGLGRSGEEGDPPACKEARLGAE